MSGIVRYSLKGRCSTQKKSPPFTSADAGPKQDRMRSGLERLEDGGRRSGLGDDAIAAERAASKDDEYRVSCLTGLARSGVDLAQAIRLCCGRRPSPIADRRGGRELKLRKCDDDDRLAFLTKEKS
jgi:hypothetical protein